MKQKYVVCSLLLASALVGAALGSHRAQASDHDDGSQAMANKNTNLTDLLVYNEKDQNSNVTTNDLIFQMNVNPRSVAKTDYAFSTNAAYDFHVTRVGGPTADSATPTGADNVMLRFQFGAPGPNGQQAITSTLVRDGASTTANAGLTTPYASSNLPNNNAVSLAGNTMTVFAGLREDTFFFDVDQFLKIRDVAIKRAGGDKQAQPVFRNPGVDFTAGYNVLSIIARVPREALQSSAAETTFDVWETISVAQ
jgi:hypothetical protein